MNVENFGLTKEAAEHIQTPDEVDTKHLGRLTYFDGVPTGDTPQKLFDELDYVRGINAYLNGLPLVSQWMLRKGFHEAGLSDGDVLVFSSLMDSNSLFLTANCDTYYFWTYLDLTDGPLVIDVPTDVLGIFDDMWWRWIGDFGIPGPDRGTGGRYVIVPEDYNGNVPEGGCFVYRCRTKRFSLIGRAFIENGDMAATDKRIKDELKIYPYVPGGYGSSIGSFLNGKSPLAPLATPQSPQFVEGSGKVINTIFPGDFEYFNLLNEAIQVEDPHAFDPEVAGHFYDIGIVKDKPFEPDARMQSILEESAAVANGICRASVYILKEEDGFYFYDEDSMWGNALFIGGYEFLTPPPMVTKEGVKPFPYDGARKNAARLSMLWYATVITPAMVMRLTGIGSEYIVAGTDKNKQPFDGAKTYKVNLPKDIPAEKFWSITIYDTQTRSMLQTEQKYPRAGSQPFPTPAAKENADGSTDIWFAPEKPNDVADGNWIQTVPGKSWTAMFRAYSPKISYYDKSWRIGEILEVE